MAAAFCFGRSQVMPSTPGVRLPRFSVTRRTAKALPLNEWVSRCCRALTLPHLPACVAFTIRAWSRRTVCLTRCQSMACHSTVSWEAAPATFSAWAVSVVVICLASSVGWPGDLVTKDQTEVCPLSRGVISLSEGNPYPSDYRSAFASSVFLYPQHYRRPLRPAFPDGSATGLPSSACVTEWGRLSLFTGDVGCPCHGTCNSVSPPQYGGISIMASGLVNDVYREFASASLPIHPSPALR